MLANTWVRNSTLRASRAYAQNAQGLHTNNINSELYIYIWICVSVRPTITYRCSVRRAAWVHAYVMFVNANKCPRVQVIAIVRQCKPKIQLHLATASKQSTSDWQETCNDMCITTPTTYCKTELCKITFVRMRTCTYTCVQL